MDLVYFRCDDERFDLVSSTMCGLRSDEQEKNSKHRWFLSLSLRICILICVRVIVIWYAQSVIMSRRGIMLVSNHNNVIQFVTDRTFAICFAPVVPLVYIISYTMFAFANRFSAICLFACFAVSISSYQLPAFVQLLSTAQLVKVGVGGGENRPLGRGPPCLWDLDSSDTKIIWEVVGIWDFWTMIFTNNFANIFVVGFIGILRRELVNCNGSISRRFF